MHGTPAYVLPPNRLETRFADKYPSYSISQALAEANRCLYCFDAPCISACPTLIDIPTFIKRIASGDTRGAATTILEANLLGASCARVCPVEVLCEGACVYNTWGRTPIAIGRLQRHATEHGAERVKFERRLDTGRTVGLVGCGPASLACAGRLSLLGHRTVIYEASEWPGGLNTTGIAPYKMPANDVLAEIEFIRALGVEIETGVEVCRDVSPAELLERHDAIFLGPGLGDDSSLGVPGDEGQGVVGAVDWIRRMKTDPNCSVDDVEQAVVVGGGNTAIDAVRELLQLGVPVVRLVYRRREQDMRAYRHEWEAAKREGGTLVANAVVSEVVRDAGRVRAVRLAKAVDGRPTPQDAGTVSADLVVVAIGQSRLRQLVESFPNVACDDRGHIVADPNTGVTGNPRVFAGGDARNGGKEVVDAVAEGQRAARAIDALLMGSEARGGTDA